MDKPVHPPSPRLELNEKGVPIVKPILHSPTPSRPRQSPQAIVARSPHYQPVHVHRTPTKNIAQRAAPVVAPVVRSSPNNLAIGRAKQEAADRASRDTFDDAPVQPRGTRPLQSPTRDGTAPTAVEGRVSKPAPTIGKDMVKQMTNEAVDGYEVPLGYVRYKTPTGVYVMPDYDKMTPVERQHVRYSFETKIDALNKAWNSQNVFFDKPPADEHLSTTFIRLDGYHRIVTRRSGISLWWLMAGAAWVGCEYVATEIFKLKADGFAAALLKNHKMFKPKIIELGEGSGFGEDWGPMTQFAVTSGIALAVIIGIGTWRPDWIQYAGEIIAELNGIVTGEVAVEVDEHGNPLPPKEGLMDKISKIDFSDMTVSKAMKLFRFIKGGDKKEKEKAKADKKPAAAKPAAPAAPPPAEAIDAARAARNARQAGLDD